MIRKKNKKKQMMKKCLLIRECQHHLNMNSLNKKKKIKRVCNSSSSVSSNLVSKIINPSPDIGIDSILNPNIQSQTLVNVVVSVTAETPSSDTTIPPPPIPIIQPLQQTPESTTTTTIPTTTLPDIPNFASLFWEEAQAENHEFLNQVDSTMKAIIKEQVQAQVSKIMPKIEKYVTESLGAEVLVRSTNQPQTSYAVAASLSEFELKKIFIDKMETNKSIDRRRSGKEAESSKELTHKESKSISSSKGASRSQPKSLGKSAQAEEHGQKVDNLEEHSHQEFNTGDDDVIPVRETLEDASQWNPSSSLTSDREWHKTKNADKRPPQPWISQLAQATSIQSSFNEFLATPIDFSAFIMHRLKIENLTQEVLTGPTYDLIKGTCKSVVELEYHLEENERGRQVIPWDYFINNDLEYLKGGSSSKKYTTSVTKTKAADYGQVKWIEDKKFYGYATNMESSKEVYFGHRIIAVTSLKIMQFFGYSHLEEVIVRRQDDKLYKFREGDFKRLRRQDIEDMLLLLVQGKLTNLNLEECYQKKINLTKPNTYHSDLKRMTPYTAYPDIQGIIYEDEMNRNHLMRTDELHKFSDGTLNHVRTALNDIATGLQMDYFPKRKWSKQDKQRARVMINAIDKKLRDRRLMRNLEKFVDGRPYGGDLRLLEKTI
ncbi:hypothetical protein Tco_1222233 [Tanacetum coccineum]